MEDILGEIRDWDRVEDAHRSGTGNPRLFEDFKKKFKKSFFHINFIGKHWRIVTIICLNWPLNSWIR